MNVRAMPLNERAPEQIGWRSNGILFAFTSVSAVYHSECLLVQSSSSLNLPYDPSGVPYLKFTCIIIYFTIANFNVSFFFFFTA